MTKLHKQPAHSILLVLILLMSFPGWAAEPVGSVFLSFGENHAIDGADNRRSLKRNDDLFVDDRLFTSQNGQLQLRFVDGSRLALKPATEFAIVDFEFNPQESQGSRTAFNLIKGGMRTLSGKIGKSADGEYRMETLVATIGIRGTYYGVEYTDQGIYVETLWGVIVVETKVGSFEVKTGQALIVDYDSGEVRYVTPTGQTAPAGFSLADLGESAVDPGFTDVYWSRWTDVKVGIQGEQQGEALTPDTSGMLDPTTSFNNLANKTGSYTYNYSSTITEPRYSDGTVTAFDSGSMTVDWSSQQINSFSITTAENLRNTQTFESTSSVSLDTVLNGGTIPVSDLQTTSPTWQGEVDVQFLGGDASGAAVNLNATGGTETLSGSAIYE